MKVSIKKNTHKGNQPVRVLKHNLTSRLEERNEEYIKNLQSDFKLNKGIAYHINDLSLKEKQLPFIDNKGIINIHETFLSYSWIICYYFFVLHEESLAIPDHIAREILIHKAPSPELLEPAEELFNYAKLLIVSFDKWDIQNLPNPEFFDENTAEGWYILRTNDLFVETINFVLYHECAHAELEHIKKIKEENVSFEDRKKLEIEADSRAIDLILSNCRDKNATSISIVIGLASILFFKNTLDGGKKHPKIDVRLVNAISIIKPEEDSYIWIMLCLFLKTWEKQFGLSLKQENEYDTYKELYYDLISQVK